MRERQAMLRCLIASRSHWITASRVRVTRSMTLRSTCTYASIGDVRTSCSRSTICSTRSSTFMGSPASHGDGGASGDDEATCDGESTTAGSGGGDSTVGGADTGGSAADGSAIGGTSAGADNRRRSRSGDDAFEEAALFLRCALSSFFFALPSSVPR